MNKENIILIVDDLMFLPKLENGLAHLGYRPLVATNPTDLNRAITQAPVLTIVDLFSQGFDWAELLGYIKGAGRKGNHIPVLGFGPHVDLELRERALAAGCTAVVGRSAITTQLPQLIEKHKWVVDETRCQDPLPELVIQGITMLNAGEFFECHEVLEDAWNAERAPIRLMYQGILQIGVACYHVQKKNWRGAVKVIEKGLPKIKRFAPMCMGLDIAKLVADSQAIRAELDRIGPDWQDEFNTALFPFIKLPE